MGSIPIWAPSKYLCMKIKRKLISSRVFPDKYVDNHMRIYGECLTTSKQLRVNVKQSATVPWGVTPLGIPGIADTIIHEEMHNDHPNMSEMEVRKRTAKIMAATGLETHRQVVSRFMREAKPINQSERLRFQMAGSSNKNKHR